MVPSLAIDDLGRWRGHHVRWGGPLCPLERTVCPLVPYSLSLTLSSLSLLSLFSQ